MAPNTIAPRPADALRSVAAACPPSRRQCPSGRAAGRNCRRRDGVARARSAAASPRAPRRAGKRRRNASVAACIAGVCRTNRIPARIAETKCSRGRVLRVRARRQVTRAATLARKETANSRKASAGPPNSSRIPPSAGPSARARLKPMPFSAIAWTRSLARHHLRDGGAPGRLIHRRSHADREGEGDQPDRVDQMRVGQHRERGGGQHGPDLAAQHELPAVHHVGERAGRQREQEWSARSSPPAPG